MPERKQSERSVTDRRRRAPSGPPPTLRGLLEQHAGATWYDHTGNPWTYADLLADAYWPERFDRAVILTPFGEIHEVSRDGSRVFDDVWLMTAAAYRQHYGGDEPRIELAMEVLDAEPEE